MPFLVVFQHVTECYTSHSCTCPHWVPLVFSAFSTQSISPLLSDTVVRHSTTGPERLKVLLMGFSTLGFILCPLFSVPLCWFCCPSWNRESHQQSLDFCHHQNDWINCCWNWLILHQQRSASWFSNVRMSYFCLFPISVNWISGVQFIIFRRFTDETSLEKVYN